MIRAEERSAEFLVVGMLRHLRISARRGGRTLGAMTGRSSDPEPVVIVSLLTIPETATALRVSERTVKRLVARGDLSVVEVGGRRLVEDVEVAAYISRNRKRRVLA
jgi:excisionase family DNA binding protein